VPDGEKVCCGMQSELCLCFGFFLFHNISQNRASHEVSMW